MRDIDALWIAMADIYGGKWTRDYGTDPAKGAGDTWAKGLADVTRRQIAAGVEACRTSADPWPPTLPQFRAMCLGIPSLAAVRLDRDKAAPFTRLVWQLVDGYRMKEVSADRAERMLRDAYELAREHVMKGGALPPEPAGLLEHDEPKPPQVPTSIEERLRRIAEARLDLALAGEELDEEAAAIQNERARGAA